MDSCSLVFLWGGLKLGMTYITILTYFIFVKKCRSSHFGSVVTNPTSIHEDVGLMPGLTQWVKDLALPWAVVYVGLDQISLSLWYRPAAVTSNGPLAWKPPYVAGAALKTQKDKNKNTLESNFLIS